MSAVVTPIENGRSLRDQFAIVALQGLLAESANDVHDSSLSIMDEEFAAEIADAAYMIANAMLERRKSK